MNLVIAVAFSMINRLNVIILPSEVNPIFTDSKEQKLFKCCHCLCSKAAARLHPSPRPRWIMVRAWPPSTPATPPFPCPPPPPSSSPDPNRGGGEPCDDTMWYFNEENLDKAIVRRHLMAPECEWLERGCQCARTDKQVVDTRNFCAESLTLWSCRLEEGRAVFCLQTSLVRLTDRNLEFGALNPFALRFY